LFWLILGLKLKLVSSSIALSIFVAVITVKLGLKLDLIHYA